MAKKTCDCCESKTCCTIEALLVIVAGVSILANVMGYLEPGTAALVTGAALALYGLGKLVHCLCLCPMCK